MAKKRINVFTSNLQDSTDIDEAYAYGIDKEGNSVKLPIRKISTHIPTDEAVLSKTEEGIRSQIKIDYNEKDRIISLKGIDDRILSQIDAKKFITGGMIENVRLEKTDEGTFIVIAFTTADGTDEVSVNVADLIDLYDGANLELSTSYAVPSIYTPPTSGMNLDNAIGNLVKKSKIDEARISALENQSKTESSGKLYAHIIEFTIMGPTVKCRSLWIDNDPTPFNGNNYQHNVERTKGNILPLTWAYTESDTWRATGFKFHAYGVYLIYSKDNRRELEFKGSGPISDTVIEIADTSSTLFGLRQIANIDEIEAKEGMCIQYIGEDTEELKKYGIYTYLNGEWIRCAIDEKFDPKYLEDDIAEIKKKDEEQDKAIDERLETSVFDTYKTEQAEKDNTQDNNIKALADYLTEEKQAEINEAISKAHTQNTDSKLVKGVQSVEVTETNIKLGHYAKDEENLAMAMGNGTSDAPNNAMSVDWNGNMKTSGDITDGEGNILAKKVTLSDLAVNGRVTFLDNNGELTTLTIEELRNLLMWVGTEAELDSLPDSEIVEGRIYSTFDGTIKRR